MTSIESFTLPYPCKRSFVYRTNLETKWLLNIYKHTVDKEGILYNAPYAKFVTGALITGEVDSIANCRPHFINEKNFGFFGSEHKL